MTIESIVFLRICTRRNITKIAKSRGYYAYWLRRRPNYQNYRNEFYVLDAHERETKKIHCREFIAHCVRLIYNLWLREIFPITILRVIKHHSVRPLQTSIFFIFISETVHNNRSQFWGRLKIIIRTRKFLRSTFVELHEFEKPPLLSWVRHESILSALTSCIMWSCGPGDFPALFASYLVGSLFRLHNQAVDSEFCWPGSTDTGDFRGDKQIPSWLSDVLFYPWFAFRNILVSAIWS